MRRTREMIAAATCCAGLSTGIAATSTAAPAHLAAAAPCSAAHTQVWLGNGEGGGYAGGTVVPLEFSNVGNRPCTLFGYPGVSAYGGSGRQTGPAGARDRSAHHVVILAPRATAHALLRIVDAGNVCGRGTETASGLRVFPPGQRSAQTISTPVVVCPHARVLFSGPVLGGVGIPGFP